MRIWKYPIQITDIQMVAMPLNAEILTAQMQGEMLCLWVKIEGPYKCALTERSIEVVGTGHEMPDTLDRKYISTFQLNNGQLVFHVFERTD